MDLCLCPGSVCVPGLSMCWERGCSRSWCVCQCGFSPRLTAWLARISKDLRVPGCVGGGWAGTPGGRAGVGVGGRGSAGPAPGRGEPPRAGGGAARQPHFGEVGGAEAGPGRARSPRKKGGGRREGRGRPPWGRGPGAAAAAVARCRRRHRCRPCGRCPCCYCSRGPGLQVRGWDLVVGTGWVGWGRVRAEFKDPGVWGWRAGLGAKDQNRGCEHRSPGATCQSRGGRDSMGGGGRAPEVRRIRARERSEWGWGVKGPRNQGLGA